MATLADHEHLLSKNNVTKSKSLRDLFHATNDCIHKKQHNSILKKCKEKFLSLETVIHDNSVCLWDSKSKSVNYLTQVTPKDVVVSINEENTFNFNPPKVTTKSSLSITCYKTDTIPPPHERQEELSEESVNHSPISTCYADSCQFGQILTSMQQRNFYLSSYESSQSSESVICRICHSTGDDKLIAPCKCDGSTRYVHASCLVTWFKKCVKNECELCKSQVKIRKINHNLTLWRKPEDRPIPLIWFSVFFIGLFLNILSIYVNASEYCKSTACLIFYVVNGFGIILDAAFLWFWFLKCRQYWKKWCALNQDWYIDVDEEEGLRDSPPLQVEYVKETTSRTVV